MALHQLLFCLKNSFCLPFLFVTPSLLPLLTSSSLTFLLPFLLLLSLLLVSPSTLSSQPFPRAPLCIILGVFFPGCSIQETHDFVLDRLIPLFFLFKKKLITKSQFCIFLGFEDHNWSWFHSFKNQPDDWPNHRTGSLG